jgi:hypothetical protein
MLKVWEKIIRENSFLRLTHDPRRKVESKILFFLLHIAFRWSLRILIWVVLEHFGREISHVHGLHEPSSSFLNPLFELVHTILLFTFVISGDQVMQKHLVQSISSMDSQWQTRGCTRRNWSCGQGALRVNLMPPTLSTTTCVKSLSSLYTTNRCTRPAGSSSNNFTHLTHRHSGWSMLVVLVHNSASDGKLSLEMVKNSMLNKRAKKEGKKRCLLIMLCGWIPWHEW